MGRVKSIAIKTLGDDLIREHPDKLSVDFESNKKALEGITEIKSKRVRNVLAGYITKKMKGTKGPGARETQKPREN
jgi:small subunit ribosomal protein S17e